MVTVRVTVRVTVTVMVTVRVKVRVGVGVRVRVKVRVRVRVGGRRDLMPNRVRVRVRVRRDLTANPNPDLLVSFMLDVGLSRPPVLDMAAAVLGNLSVRGSGSVTARGYGSGRFKS